MGGDIPPQVLSLQRVLPELPQGGEKCFGFGCAARRAPALATLEGKITIAAGAGSSPARAALPKGILMGGRWHPCQLPAMGTAQLGAAGAAGWVWGGPLVTVHWGVGETEAWGGSEETRGKGRWGAVVLEGGWGGDTLHHPITPANTPAGKFLPAHPKSLRSAPLPQQDMET